MNHSQQKRFNFLYEQQLTNLKPQGKRSVTIYGYSRAVQRISAYFGKYPDGLHERPSRQAKIIRVMVLKL